MEGGGAEAPTGTIEGTGLEGGDRKKKTAKDKEK